MDLFVFGDVVSRCWQYKTPLLYTEYSWGHTVWNGGLPIYRVVL